MNPKTFEPTDETRAILRLLTGGLADEAQARFFEAWEAEIANPDAPRRAGAVVANAYLRNAARFGVFGAKCAGYEPNFEMWMALAKEHFDQALEDYAASCAILSHRVVSDDPG